MDPITLGIAGLAGFVLVKKISPTTPSPGDTTPSAGTSHGAPIVSQLTKTANFSLGAKKAEPLAAQPLDGAKVLSTAIGIATTAVGVVAAVGGGSFTAGLGSIAGAVGAGAAIALAVVAIAGFVVIVSMFGASEIDGLSRGRRQYMSDILILTDSIRNAILNAERQPSSPSNGGATPSDELLGKYASCYAFAAVRGFNRAHIAWCLHNSDAIDQVNTTNEFIISHWADRSRCIEEEGYISNLTGANAFIAKTMGTYDSTDERTIETHLFGTGSYVQACSDLIAANMWHPSTSPGNEEHSADFLGRALGCTHVANSNWATQGRGGGTITVVLNAEENAGRYLADGMIGIKEGVPGQGRIFSNVPVLGDALVLATRTAAIDRGQGFIRDLDGNSGLKWFYNETANTGTTVVR